MKSHLFCVSLAIAFIAFCGTRAPAFQGDSNPHGMEHEPTDAAHDEHLEHIGVEGANAEADEVKGDLAIFTFVVFLLLLGILYKFAWGPISAGLEKREHRIAEHIAAAERSHQEAKAMLAEYERKLAAAQDEVRAILDEARRDAEHTHQEILAKAKAEAAAEAARARHDVETARDQALKQLIETSANLAVDLAGQILKAKLSPADHSKLISEAVAKFHPQHASQN